MSRQIQSRRGTAAEHENFIGAIGEITMDTTNKTLRVHDGTTPGGFALARADAVSEGATLPEGCDFVIESQFPSADNNYTWYRKYNSGWVEQGGYSDGAGAAIQISLIKEMCDSKYTIMLTGLLTSGTAGATTSVSTNAGQITSTDFSVNNYIENGSNKGTGIGFWWEVRGMGA